MAEKDSNGGMAHALESTEDFPPLQSTRNVNINKRQVRGQLQIPNREKGEHLTVSGDNKGRKDVSKSSNDRGIETAKETVSFGRLEEASREMEVAFENLERGTKYSRDKDSDRDLLSLEDMKIRAANLGIELTRALVEFSLLPVHPSQMVKQFQLRGWILQQSREEESEVFFLVDFLLYTVEEDAKDMMKAAAKRFLKEKDLSGDQVSGDEKINDDLIEKFAKAIRGLQRTSSYLQREPGISERNELALADGFLYLCDENLRAAKAGTDKLKEITGHKTDEAFRQKMELQINQYWSDGFWVYVSTTCFFKSLPRFPFAIYTLSKLFVQEQIF